MSSLKVAVKSLVLILWLAGQQSAQASVPQGSLLQTVVGSIQPAAYMMDSTLTTGDRIIHFIGYFFIGVIILLFLFSLFFLWRYRRQLPAQHAALKRVHENYDSIITTAEANPQVIQNQLLRDVNPKSIAAQRVEELHWISIHGGDFDQVALAEVLTAREGAKTSFAKYVASMLVLLGLCGAIFGLSNLVFQMGPELREMQELTRRSGSNTPAARSAGVEGGVEAEDPLAKSVSGLINTMADSLEHTRSAFIASLSGVLSSVILLFFNWYVSRQQIRFLTELEDLTATKLIPIFKPPREASELAAAVEAFKEASTQISALSSDLDKTISGVGRSMRDFDDIVYKFRTGTETLQQSHERIEDSYSALNQKFSDFTEVSREIAHNQAKTNEAINVVVTAVGESDKRFNRTIEVWQQNNETLLQRIQTVSERAKTQANEAREDIQRAVKDITDLVKTSFTEQLKILRDDTLAALKIQQDVNQNLLREIVKDQKEFIKELQESVNGDGHRELINGMTGVIREEREGFATHLDKKLEQERETFSARLKEMLTHSEQVVAAVKEPRPQMIVSMMEENRTVLKDISEYLRQQRQQPAGLAVLPDTPDALAKQDKLVRGVGSLNHSFNRLTSMLRIMLGLAGFSVLVLGLLGLVRKFNLWPADETWHVFLVAGIVATGAFAAWFLVWLTRPQDDVLETVE